MSAAPGTRRGGAGRPAPAHRVSGPGPSPTRALAGGSGRERFAHALLLVTSGLGGPWVQPQLPSSRARACFQMASATDARYGQKESSDQNFDYMFKILIIGNSSVGKTSFLFRYADDSFTPAFVSTVGIDFKVKTIYRNDKRIKLQIWDTAGQERYRTITTAYYRGAMGFILMYDITNEESFNAVQDWSTQIKTYSWDNAQVLLVGNKCDMEDERVVSSERGRQLAEHLGFEFFEASAKDNINVKQTFERLVDIICEKMSESLDTADPAVTGAKQGPQLTDQQAPPHQDCAC
ncbi:ras-related protein Rab-3A [Alligator sinensis]|uniref:Ras-related protein Rab-3 n=1 Tax=Alligator sinensis TaxID=38654 RepID=A0A3Q0H1Y7_ALLSI|nr:ras-related protein Rab-3A [Alligator sinensis]